MRDDKEMSKDRERSLIERLNAGPVIENLVKANNLNYHSIIVEAKQIQNFNYPNQQGSIQIPIDSLSKILEN